MAELRFRAEASADLIDIYGFSLEHFGRDVADDYQDGLEAACARLANFPRLGPIYPVISPALRYLTFRNHHIFYDIQERTVFIVRILHHAMNAAPHLRQ